MAANHSESATGQDGSTNQAGSNPDDCKVAVFVPDNPNAFDNARDAAFYTRLSTRHSGEEVGAALRASPDIHNTFCLAVHSVILVFSASAEEHAVHCRKLFQMLQDRSMSADIHDCVFKTTTSIAAGIRLDPVGEYKMFMVIDEGVPGR